MSAGSALTLKASLADAEGRHKACPYEAHKER
jgi:hypothetical protein